MYVETDCLFALAKPDDWLQAEAKAALERDDVHTSILAYAEFLIRTYDRGQGFDFDVPRLVANPWRSSPSGRPPTKRPSSLPRRTSMSTT